MSLLTKLMGWRWPGQRYKRANARDLYYCYRLLLQRQPDRGSWDHWLARIKGQQIDLQTLVDGFLGTEEFQKMQAAARQEILVRLDGYQLYVRPNDFFVGAAIARDKVYEPAVTASIRELLKAGDTFVDVGANIGYFTCLAAALVGPTGNVYAFEPNPDNIYLISRSVASNNFANVNLHPVAVAEKEQHFKLDASSASSNARVIDYSPQAIPGVNPPIVVKAVTLDNALATVSRIDVIKLDIEGAELRAWQGMQQLVQRHRPIILFEYSPELLRVTSHVDPKSLLEAVNKAGYDLYVLSSPEGRSETAQSIEEVTKTLELAGGTHLDLVAYPK